MVTRRRFLKLVGAVAAATGLPPATVARALQTPPIEQARELTTLAVTLGAGSAGEGGYRPVVALGGEPHIVREELVSAQGGRADRRRSLLCFVHLTDQHIVDVQSPSRVEFLDRFAAGECASIPFSSAYRPWEAASARIADSMLARLRRVAVSPVTGAPIAAAVCTGDNTDNMQANELGVHLGVMDGGIVRPNSGDLARYEGVQASGDAEYWHPDPAIDDVYKSAFGFPARPGFLEAALEEFEAVGLGAPWYSAYGNHDGLEQGNAPANPVFEAISTGSIKVVGPPPGATPCTVEDALGSLPVAPGMPTTADAERRFVRRQAWVAGHLDAPGLPAGHGFTQANVDANTAYYTADPAAGLRFVVLDTVNPGGLDAGSLGQIQLDWLNGVLTAADEEGRLALVFSHHGLRSLDSVVPTPDPLDPEGSDLPRHLADDVLAVVNGHPSVIAWVNGHTHDNVIELHETEHGGFWDIGTAAHIDWPCQSRILEIVDNDDGTLSIFTTMVDHDDDGVSGFARELAGNDPQSGFASGTGEAADRNTELLLPHPFAGAQPSPSPSPSPTPSPAPSPSASPSPTASPPVPSANLPATGLPSGLTIGGALMVASLAGVRALRRPR